MAAAGNTQHRPQFTWLGIERKDKEREGSQCSLQGLACLQFIKNSHCGPGDAHLEKVYWASKKT